MSSGPERRINTVLLDVDGTLVDTNHLHALAWARAIRAHGHAVTIESVRRRIGAGSSVLMNDLIGRVDEDVAAAWRADYDAMSDDVAALPGATDLIGRLRSDGLSVVVASSSPGDLLDRHLGVLGLERDDVDGVTTDDDVEEAKPDPEVFTAAMHTVDAEADRTLVVGDSVWDLRAADRAGVGAIGVLTGGTCRAALMEEGAVAVFEDLEELLEEIDRSPLAADG